MATAIVPASLPESDLISGSRARRMLGGCGWYKLHHAVLTGAIRAEVQPGRTIRYSKADVERLAEATTRARSRSQVAGGA
jgi:hypothetical protein